MTHIIDAIISVFCAALGGVITLLGVRWTILYNQKQEKEKEKAVIRPIFYRIDPFQGYDTEGAMELFFRFQKKGKMYQEVSGTFKNTDHAIMKIRSITMGDLIYYPQNGNVIDKNMLFSLRILTNQIPKKRDILMEIEDVLGNPYFYKMCFEKQFGFYEITTLEEINEKGKSHKKIKQKN